MLNAAQNKVERPSPTSPIATGAMDSLLQKLRDAGPTQRQQRDARRRARLKNVAKQRKASTSSVDPNFNGDDENNTDKDGAELSSGGGDAGEISDVPTDVEAPMVSSPTVIGGDTPTSSTTSGVPRKVSSKLTVDGNDPASRAQNMLQMLKGGGEGGDETDSVTITSLGSFRTGPRNSADEGRRTRRRQRQASSSQSQSTNGSTSSGLGIGLDPGPMTGEDAAARAKSLLLSMGARRGSAEEGGPVGSSLLGLASPAGAGGNSSVVDDGKGGGGGAGGGLPTPTIEIEKFD